jgi:pyrroloquinoline quinone biosynthesis protein B
MIIKILGTASIGGVPEWDCTCKNCTNARKNYSLRRNRSSIAITLDKEKYVVIDTGHDIKIQLETHGLTPRKEITSKTHRESRISHIFLTHGHADHTVGLAEFCTGKSFEIPVYGPPDLIDFLFGTPDHTNYFGDLGRLSKNYVIPNKLKEEHVLTLSDNLKIQGFEIPHTITQENGTKYPSTTYAYEIKYNEKRFVYAPDLGKLTPNVLRRIEGSDVFMMDATFWWDDELNRISGIPITSYWLGHVPQSNSVEILREMAIDRIIYTHFNHTNPVLDPQQPFQKMVREAGQEIAFDGMEITL